MVARLQLKSMVIRRFRQYAALVESVHSAGSAHLLRLPDSFKLHRGLLWPHEETHLLHRFRSSSRLSGHLVRRNAAVLFRFGDRRGAVPQLGETHLRSAEPEEGAGTREKAVGFQRF